MQSFELLGGKYQQGEQILPGVIQTFRSYEVPTGRPVFIHRIPSDNPVAQEIAGLLSAGLIRSPAVRKMLLDVYESEPYRFVVTEPARQCVPLLDWLEREANDTEEPVREAAAATEPPARMEPQPVEDMDPVAEAEPEAVPEPEASAVPEIEPPPDAEGSEFARLFHEALSGKLERSRRNALQESPPVEALPRVTDKPAAKQEPKKPEAAVAPSAQPKMTLVPREAAPAGRTPQLTASKKPAPAKRPAPAAPTPTAEPQLFSQVGETKDAGRSTLIIFLVVLGVLVVLVVMFVVVFLKR